MSAFINDETNEIELTRGDSLLVTLHLIRDGEEVTPPAGSTIRFALKKSTKDKGEPLILVNIPIDNMLLELKPEHTQDLPFGDYVYDVQITTANGIRDTFIPPSKFTIGEEVWS